MRMNFTQQLLPRALPGEALQCAPWLGRDRSEQDGQALCHRRMRQNGIAEQGVRLLREQGRLYNSAAPSEGACP
jgi:hypothetical protein